ncbi:MFS transporter [Ideonella sp. BN130291]|uniref:MFS transporter n=1 Tax=Ideonella sp. BN130291 TaxID=3112940 RepID=UPI002E270125|nr:MFS transporter [Ideonella sp. BN130291]
MALTLMVTLFVGYLDRMNVSLALPLIAQQYGWSVEQTRVQGGQLLTVFYVGYGLANLFLSPLAARLGPRVSLMAVVLLWSLFTAMGALLSASLTALLATRVLLGLSEGVHFPMMNMLTKRWFPPGERARANSVWMGGLLLAVCLAPVLLIPLMHSFGWTRGFLVLALAGPLVSLPLVWRHVHDTPERHPRISAEEAAYIERGNAAEAQAAAPGWRTVARTMARPGVLLMLACGTLYNVVSVGLSLWLPTYFVTAKGLPYEQLVYATSLPYVAGVVGLALWSTLGDRFNRRALVAAFGFVGGGAAIWLALTAPGVAASVAAFTVAVFCISAFSAAEFSLVQRLFPPAVVGPCAGIYNGLTTMVGGGAGPLVVAGIIGRGAEGSPAGVLAAVVVCGLAAALLAVVARLLRY